MGVFTIFKLYKWYQIAQSIKLLTNVINVHSQEYVTNASMYEDTEKSKTKKIIVSRTLPGFQFVLK